MIKNLLNHFLELIKALLKQECLYADLELNLKALNPKLKCNQPKEIDRIFMYNRRKKSKIF